MIRLQPLLVLAEDIATAFHARFVLAWGRITGRKTR